MKKVLIQILMTSLLFSIISCNSAVKDSMTKVKVKESATNKLLVDVSAAICYSGFRTGQHPDRGDGANNPSDKEIIEDLELISDLGFKLIRLYDCEENSQAVLRLIDEKEFDIKVLLGVWLRAEVSNHEGCPWLNEPIPQVELESNWLKNQNELIKGIELANQYQDIVASINIGNEALVEWNDHMVSLDSVIAYVEKAKAAIQQPVTVADNFAWWANSGKKLAEVVDFVSIHVYPVWENKDIEEGLSYSKENVQMVKDSLPNSNIVITEAGWASEASEFGERASEEKQLRYYTEIMEWAKKENITTFFFEAFDEDWKGNPDNPLGAEKHWGLYTVDRQPKLVVQSIQSSQD